MSLATLLAPLVDAPTLDLEHVTHVLVAEDGEETSLDFARLLRLAARLPSGLVHAESVWMTSVPPVGLAPLAPGSAWSALDRALIVTLPPGRAALVGTALDLARYALAADEVRRILGPQPELVSALLAPAPLDAAAATRLALALGADPELVTNLDRRSPGLRADLGHMAQRDFRPRVQLHTSTRPSRWRRLGASIARRLLETIPPGPFRLVVADAPDVVEHLSPYARDVAPLLNAWAHENPHEIAVRGLIEALAVAPRAHASDLSTLVIRDLLRAHTETLEERRTVERACGLELFDEAGMVFGYAEVSNLPAPDARAIPAGSRGILAVVAGPSDETLLAATTALLDTGRVDGLSVIARGGPDLEATCAVPELLVSTDDALVLDVARLVRRVEALGIRLARGRRVAVDAERGAPPWAFAALRLMRRAMATGLFPADGRACLALHARSAAQASTELDAATAALQAARIGLMGLQLAEAPPTTRPPETSKGPGSLRFRA